MTIRNYPWWKPGSIAAPVAIPLGIVITVVFDFDTPLITIPLGLTLGFVCQALARRWLDYRHRADTVGPTDGRW